MTGHAFPWAGGARVLPAVCTAVLLLAGCGPGDDDPGPGGVTVGEARALDEAAAMLDAQAVPEEALRGDRPAAQPTPAEEPEPR